MELKEITTVQQPIELTERQQAAVRDFEKAKEKLRTPRDGDKGAEFQYARAFQRMVREGVGVQIKKKYRCN